MNHLSQKLMPRRVQLKLHTRFEGQKLFLTAAVMGEPSIAQGGSIELELFNWNENKVMHRRKVRHLLPGFKKKWVLSMDRIPSGNCWFRGVLTDRHGLQSELEIIQDKAVKPPWWLGSAAGITQKVPAPWTPVKTATRSNGIATECWGRKYEFGRKSLLRQVMSAEKLMLAAPIRLIGKVNGRNIAWTKSSLKSIKCDKDRSVVVHDLVGTGLSLHLRAQVEFDGMVRMDWTLSTKKAARLDSLVFEMPLRAQHAKYIYHFPGQWESGKNACELGRNGLQTEFRPFIWLGDEQRGLSWFCESDENWFSKDPQRVTQIVRRDGKVIVRLHLVSRPITLLPTSAKPGERVTGLGTEPSVPSTAGLRYTMGLQATPVKPVEKDAWDRRIICHWELGGEQNALLAYDSSILDAYVNAGIGTVAIGAWTDIEMHATTNYGKKLKRLIKACHDRGLKVLLGFGFLISDRTPEWQDFGKQCVVQPKGGYPVSHYPPQPLQSSWTVCLRSEWQDLLAAGVARAMREFDADGVYLDGTELPLGCCNTNHGCGTLRSDGSIAPTYPIFAVRSAMRRIYHAVRSQKPDGQLNVHNSTCMTIPTLGWATSSWDGEQFRLVHKTPGIRGRMPMPMDTFRTEFMGHQWGVPAEFLCQSEPFSFNHRQAWGFCLLHDVPVRASRMEPDQRLNTALWNVMDRFGRKQAEWLPYWSNDEYVKVSRRHVYASIYRHPKNGVVAVVANVSNRKVSASVRFHLQRLKLRPNGFASHDAMTGKSIDVPDGKFNCNLGVLGWRLLWLKNE